MTNSMVTGKSITERDIRALGADADRAGDIVMRVIVDKYLGELSDDPEELDADGQPDYSGGGHTSAEMARIAEVLGSWSEDDCLAECVRVVNDARGRAAEVA